MTTVIIYKREETTLHVKGRWEDGTWVMDKEDFASINNIDQYDAEMLLERFNGPYYFAVKEINAPLTIPEINIPTRGNAVKKNNGTSDLVLSKIRLANKLEDGYLDESDYTNEEIEEIKSWKWYDG